MFKWLVGPFPCAGVPLAALHDSRLVALAFLPMAGCVRVFERLTLRRREQAPRWVVPAAQQRRSVSQISPSLVMCSRSCASGGRSAWRRNCSSRSRWPARVISPACKIEPAGLRVTWPQRRRRDFSRWVAAPAYAPPPEARLATRPSTDAAATAGRTGALFRPQVRRLATLGAARNPSPLEQTRDPARDQGHDLCHVVACRGYGIEPHDIPVLREHAVQHERVQVDIEIQRTAEALHDRHRATATIRDTGTAPALIRSPRVSPDWPAV